MEELTIAVTGVGAIIGQGIIRSLRTSKRKVRIVGIDRNARSAGRFMADIFEQKPTIAEDTPEYLEFWKGVIRRYEVCLILPGIDVDMLFFNQHRAWFEKVGCVLALNTPDLIRLASDKWQMGIALEAIGYPVIPSCQPDSWDDALQTLGPPPLLLKPLQGSGSRGIVQLQDARDFNYWRVKADYPWMLQRIVGTPDEEYTVGVFGLGNGQTLGPIIFRRRLSSAGNTQEAEVILDHPILNASVQKLCTHFCPLGPTNLQFRIEDDKAYLLEINPRFSSSNSIRTAFGFNEAVMSIEFYIEKRAPEMPAISRGFAWRYTEDYIVYDSDSV